MAKVTVDGSLCTGCGLCVSECPDCFEIGDDNVARVKACASGACNVNEVAGQCPLNAISVK